MKLIAYSLCMLVLLFRLPAYGQFDSYDASPGATLLLPYFEVDVIDANGADTVFRIANASGSFHIAHVVLWTDWGIPTLGFELFLTPFASIDVSLREVFAGQLPPSTPFLFALPATTSGISAICEADTLSVEQTLRINDAHTGGPAAHFGNMCTGANFGDGIARGFVTVDLMTDCTDQVPVDPEYFDVTGIENALWGTVAWINRTEGTSAGAALTPLQYSLVEFGPTFYTFLAGSEAADGREILPGLWYAPYYNDTRQSDAIVWREPDVVASPQTCGMEPPMFPLQDGFTSLRSESGDLTDVSAFEPFPLVTNRVRIGSSNLPSPYPGGLLEFVLPPPPPVVLAQTSGFAIFRVPQAQVLLLHDLGNGQSAAVSGSSQQLFLE